MHEHIGLRQGRAFEDDESLKGLFLFNFIKGGTPRFYPKGVLNHKVFQGQICPGCDDASQAPGRFKEVRPARPQPF